MPTADGPRDDEVDLLIDAWSDLLPDVDLTPLDVMSRLRRAARRLSRLRTAAFAAEQLAAWEFDVLAVLRKAGSSVELAPADLISSTATSSAAMTNRLDKLTARGLVQRRPNPNDRRGVLIRITAAGVERVDAAMTELVRREAALLAELDTGDAAVLVRLLRRLSD